MAVSQYVAVPGEQRISENPVEEMQITPERRLVVIAGPPGSGKSTLARSLARHLVAAYLDSDLLTEPLFPADRDSPAYRAARPALYEAVYALADANLRLGLPVVIDAPHLSLLADPAWHARLARLAADAEARLALIVCDAPPEVLRARMQARAEPRDTGKLAHWESVVAGLAVPASLPAGALRLDATRPAAEMLAEAVAWVNLEFRAFVVDKR